MCLYITIETTNSRCPKRKSRTHTFGFLDLRSTHWALGQRRLVVSLFYSWLPCRTCSVSNRIISRQMNIIHNLSNTVIETTKSRWMTWVLQLYCIASSSSERVILSKLLTLLLTQREVVNVDMTNNVSSSARLNGPLLCRILGKLFTSYPMSYLIIYANCPKCFRSSPTILGSELSVSSFDFECFCVLKRFLL